MNNPPLSADSPIIGKNALESLTTGMYEDCRCIYREYVQNSADAIDAAIAQNIMEEGGGEVFVDITPRTIVIRDNGTGVSAHKAPQVLRNIANSAKVRGEDKGFRGIGRLGGLSYCDKLTFETSGIGEDLKTIIEWDAVELRRIFNDHTNNQDAATVVAQVTKCSVEKAEASEHYFVVRLEGVKNETLLNHKIVREYLQMVAPVEIEPRFVFRSQIADFVKKNNLRMDCYNIYINGDQVFKPYTTSIYEEGDKNSKKKVDEIGSLEFMLERDGDGQLLYWGWYTVSNLKGQMKSVNAARGIRLRKENIQIGDEEICKKFFPKTNDQRFSFYFFGEIHAVGKGLIPNSQRDYFEESAECGLFESKLIMEFARLRTLCYDASDLRKLEDTQKKTADIRNVIRQKEKNGYTSASEKESLQQKLEKQQKAEDEARKKAEKVLRKIGNGEVSPLKGLAEKVMGAATASQQDKTDKTAAPVAKKTDKAETEVKQQKKEKIKYRTDGPAYSAYDKKERRLIGRIYEAIEGLIGDENFRNVLIDNIEKKLAK